MKKTALPGADPYVSCAILGDRIRLCGGQAVYGNKPAILKVGDSRRRGHPNSASIVLKNGLHPIIWQSRIRYFEYTRVRRARLTALPFLFGAACTFYSLFTVDRNLP